MYLVLLGLPGAGKGTQSRRLAEEFNLRIIATGDLFREEIRKGTELGRLVEKYLKDGTLVPDDIVIDIVKKIIGFPKCTTGVIFDGFPRTIKQANALDELLSKCNRKISLAINIEISDEEVIKRNAYRRICVNCGQVYHILLNPPRTLGICDICGGKIIQRPDDREEVIKKRLLTYRRWTKPIIQYYRDKGILVNIDGTKSIDEVYHDIKKAILERKIK